jgi:hypothetical protein
MKRKSITKKCRFEVFKRDSFTCQYCGKSAPDVVLEIDHIKPVVEGGDNSLLNLVTSCFDCNRGKGKRKLSDNSSVKKQAKQLKLLKDKNEQLKMLLDYRESISDYRENEVNAIQDVFKSTTGYGFSIKFKKKVKGFIKKYELNEVLDSLDICINQYYKDNDDTAELVLKKLPKVLASRLELKNNPGLEEFYKCSTNILYKVSYYSDWQSRNMLRGVYESVGIDAFKRECRNIFFKDDILRLYNNVC